LDYPLFPDLSDLAIAVFRSCREFTLLIRPLFNAMKAPSSPALDKLDTALIVPIPPFTILKPMIEPSHFSQLPAWMKGTELTVQHRTTNTALCDQQYPATHPMVVKGYIH